VKCDFAIRLSPSDHKNGKKKQKRRRTQPPPSSAAKTEFRSYYSRKENNWNYKNLSLLKLVFVASVRCC